jgi:hypothetical protein
MRLLLLLCALACPAQAAIFAHAETNDDRVLNLRDTKCEKGGWEVELATTNTIVFQGCWIMHPSIEGAIYIKWRDGDESVVPRSVFKPGSKPTV